jgi:hypothetical protein
MHVERGDHDHPGPPPFPALDPELTRSEQTRRWLRNCAVTAAVIVILAGLGGLTAYLVRGHAPHGSASGRHGVQQTVKTLPASAAPAGTVLSQTPQGALTLSDLRGQHPKLLMSLPQQVYVGAADSRYVATSNGLLLSIGAHGRLSATRMRNVSASTWSPAGLSDHDQYIALENDNGSSGPGENSIDMTSLETGKSRSLGTGDTISGDPTAVGVIVSLPAVSVTTGAPTNGLWPDGSVVLRDAGSKNVLLGTAAQLNADVHLPAGALTDFQPQPDPAGDKIAIVVRPDGRGSGGVVVVTRTGRELYALGGLGSYASASWSPSGRSLAIAAPGPRGSVLHIWNASGSTPVQPFPGQADYGDCVWSPDGARILCALVGEHSNGEQWVVAAADGGPMVVTKGPGYPISWLGAGQ